MSKKVEFTEDAREAMEILEYIRDNGGDMFDKYQTALNYIKKSGRVSPIFLGTIRTAKQELKIRK